MTDSELIKNHTIFFAYFCYLIETNQADNVEELCEIGWVLDEEIKKRKITNSQIDKCISQAELNPQDQLMVAKYIYSNSSFFKSKIGNS